MSNVDYLDTGTLAFSVSSQRSEYPWSLVLLDLKSGNLRYLADYSNGNNAVAPMWSPDGKHLLYSLNRDCVGIFVVDIEANRVRRLDRATEGDGDCQAVWSPAGRQIAYMSHRDAGENGFEIEIMNLEEDTHRRLTSESGGYPIWSPDGEWIIYYSPRRDLRHFHMRSDGSEDQLFVELPDERMRVSARTLSWSPDRTKIVFSAMVWADGNPKSADWGKQQLYIADADGRNARLLIPDVWFSCAPIFSPSGESIAVLGRYNEGYGSRSIYILENGELRELVQQTYSEDGQWCMWSPDGRYIAYTPFHGRTFQGSGVYIVEVSTGRRHQVFDEIAAYPVWCPVVL